MDLIMRYTQLRAFHQVALHQGFTRAAEVMALSQPALSDQVRKLEQMHDVLLFHRDRKQVRLTRAGAALFRLTRQFFEVEEQILSHLSEARAAIDGTLRIIADSAHHITGPLGRFRTDHPGVFVSLRTGNSEVVLAALRNYEAEIGVIGSLPDAPDLESHDIGASPILAICAREGGDDIPSRLSLGDLPRQPLIFREPGSKTREKLERAAKIAGLSLLPAIEVEGREAMREVVAAGAGLGFVSQAEVGNDDRLRAIPIDGPDLVMTESLVHLKMRRDVPTIRAFMRCTGRPVTGEKITN